MTAASGVDPKSSTTATGRLSVPPRMRLDKRRTLVRTTILAEANALGFEPVDVGWWLTRLAGDERWALGRRRGDATEVLLVWVEFAPRSTIHIDFLVSDATPAELIDRENVRCEGRTVWVMMLEQLLAERCGHDRLALPRQRWLPATDEKLAAALRRILDHIRQAAVNLPTIEEIRAPEVDSNDHDQEPES